MSNTYILLKDLPDGSIVGDEYAKYGDQYRNERFRKDKSPVIEDAAWFTWQVENNPSWFKLKEQVEEKRIEVGRFSIQKTFGKSLDNVVYEFSCNNPIPTEKYEAVKQAIERELNGEGALFNYGVLIPSGAATKADGTLYKADPNVKVPVFDCPPAEKNNKDEFPQYIATPTPEPQDRKEDKGWEIVAFKTDMTNVGVLTKNADGTFGHYECIEQDLLSSSAHFIHSVRRTSDREVFEVNKFNNGKVIKRFFIGWNGMEIHYTDGSASLLLEEPFLPKEEPKPLFVTEDGVGIFDVNTTVHKVHKTDISYELSNACHVNNNKTYNDKFYFVFSTKEVAKNFILINKPCLSVEDVLRITRTINNNDTKSYLNSELKQLANHKINNKQ